MLKLANNTPGPQQPDVPQTPLPGHTITTRAFLIAITTAVTTVWCWNRTGDPLVTAALTTSITGALHHWIRADSNQAHASQPK